MWGELLNEAARQAQGPRPETAQPVIDRCLQQRPDDADALTLAGIVAQRTGRTDAAIAAFTRARDADPTNPARHQNMAVALKNGGRFEAARAVFGEALRLRPGHAATLANLGSCLIEMNLFEEALAVLDAAGEHPDALNNGGVALARLGRHAEAAERYQAALRLRPGNGDVTINLADALCAGGEDARAERLLTAITPGQPAFVRGANQLGLLRERRGDFSGAVAALRPAFAAAPANHALGINLARLLIRADAPDDAIAVCDALIASQPSITTPLALKLAALTRLDEGSRRSALMALDRFVRVEDVSDVPGYPDMQSFNAALMAELISHRSLTYEPEGLVTRQGRQSDDLAAESSPAISALARLATNALAETRERLAQDDIDHPFLAALPDQWSLTLWGTILQPGGEVTPHIHAPNWLSGVYYPDFGDDSDEGAFGIGMLPAELGGGGDVTIIRPRAGRMLLFPSYLWHATLPFGGDADRISFAFDLVPAGSGRPHRLVRS